ncbi:MAG: transposase, partial [Nitrososphaerota archaeon]
EVIKAVVFKHNADVKSLLETFNQMVNECIEYALTHKVYSPIKLERILYAKFKQKYDFATHYCISACRVACSSLKSWRRLVKKRRADPREAPVVRALAMRLQKELMRFKGDRIIITTKPYEWHEVPLIVGEHQKRFIEAWKRGELKVGEITLLGDRVIVAFRKEAEERKPMGYASIDVNLMSLDVLKAKENSLEYEKVELKKLYEIRAHCFKKRRKIQKLSKIKPKTAEKLMQKYSKREKRRVNNMLHKITTDITRELAGKGLSPIFEKLKGLNYNSTRNRYAKCRNRKVSSLPYRKIQSFIEYKMAWLGYKTQYVDAKNTSKTCPRCGSLSKVRGQTYKCEKCGYEADRHFVTCVNILRMWGFGFTPKALNEIVERKGLCMSIKDYVAQNPF